MIGSIAYSTTGSTNADVTATISFNKTGVSVTNNGGSTSYTFTGNDSFTFEFIDAYGNTGSETATVTWIDKSGLGIGIIYDPAASHSGTVTVIATLNSTGGASPAGRTSSGTHQYFTTFLGVVNQDNTYT